MPWRACDPVRVGVRDRRCAGHRGVRGLRCRPRAGRCGTMACRCLATREAKPGAPDRGPGEQGLRKRSERPAARGRLGASVVVDNRTADIVRGRPAGLPSSPPPDVRQGLPEDSTERAGPLDGPPDHVREWHQCRCRRGSGRMSSDDDSPARPPRRPRGGRRDWLKVRHHRDPWIRIPRRDLLPLQ